LAVVAKGDLVAQLSLLIYFYDLKACADLDLEYCLYKADYCTRNLDELIMQKKIRKSIIA